MGVLVTILGLALTAKADSPAQQTIGGAILGVGLNVVVRDYRKEA